ncbi:aldo/keto reductase family protein [Sporobolomyces koalae]|uniref:aldo/keto reductase family protein n=1 Tax=Sporobolomyces koalae TaxID=500713 RepID=UPI00317B7B58
MPIPSRKIANTQVGAVGSGWMRMDWVPNPISDEQAFEAMQTAISLGSTFWNSGAFYSSNPDDKTANLSRIARFIEKYPEHRDAFFLSVKGGLEPDLSPNADLDFLRKDVETINAKLGGRKMDLYEMARVDTKVGIEQTMKNLIKLRDEGHFKYIGLSECSADTIKKASAIGPVSAVEVEFSPFCPDIESNGVLAACKEFGITIVGYSPLGGGFLTGKIKSNKDFDEGDFRRHWDRFSDENMPHNLKLVEKLEAVANQKNVTTAQIAVAWILHQADNIIPLPGSSRPEGVRESVEAANIELSQEDLDQIRKAVDEADIKGVRYVKNPHVQDKLFA